MKRGSGRGIFFLFFFFGGGDNLELPVHSVCLIIFLNTLFVPKLSYWTLPVKNLLSEETPPALSPVLLKLTFPHTFWHHVKLLTARYRLQRAQDVVSRTPPLQIQNRPSIWKSRPTRCTAEGCQSELWGHPLICLDPPLLEGPCHCKNFLDLSILLVRHISRACAAMSIKSGLIMTLVHVW